MCFYSDVEAAASACCSGAAVERSFGVTRYFNDVWEYATEEHKWTCRSTGAASAPAARGGCQVVIHGTVLFVLGGHTAWKEGKQEQEKVHDDVWALDLQTWQVSIDCFSTFLPFPPPLAPCPPPHFLLLLLQIFCMVVASGCMFVEVVASPGALSAFIGPAVDNRVAAGRSLQDHLKHGPKCQGQNSCLSWTG